MAVFGESSFPQDVTQKMLRAPMGEDVVSILGAWSSAGLDEMLQPWTPEQLAEARELQKRKEFIDRAMGSPARVKAINRRIRAKLEKALGEA